MKCSVEIELEDAIYRGINPTRIEERFTELLNK